MASPSSHSRGEEKRPLEIQRECPRIREVVNNALQVVHFEQEELEWHNMSLRWLDTIRMGYCIPILQSKDLLLRLGEIALEGPKIFCNQGLPTFVVNELVAHAVKGRVSEEPFKPQQDGCQPSW